MSLAGAGAGFGAALALGLAVGLAAAFAGVFGADAGLAAALPVVAFVVFAERARAVLPERAGVFLSAMARNASREVTVTRRSV